MKSKFILLFLFLALKMIGQDHVMLQQIPIFDKNGLEYAKQKIVIKVHVVLDSVQSKKVYEEVHHIKTSKKGIANFELGKGIHKKDSSLLFKKDKIYFLNLEVDFGQGFTPYISNSINKYQKTLTNSSNFLPIGKNKINITNDTSDDAAKKQLLLELGPNTQHLSINKTTVLEKLDLSKLTSLHSLQIENNELLNDVLFPDLEMVEGDVSILFNANLCFFSFDKFKSAKKFVMQYNRVNELFFPSLTTTEMLMISNNPNLYKLEIPSFSLITGFYGIDFTHNSFSVDTVDTILEQLLKVKPLERKSVKMISQDPPAFPSPKGMEAKNKLNEMGNFVSTD